MLRAKRQNKLLAEPAAVATGDIAFNLIVFFLVCASTQPDSGRKQDLPSSEKTKAAQEVKNVELGLTRTRSVVSLNGDPIKTSELHDRLRRILEGKKRAEDRIIVVKSKSDVPYDHWIAVTSVIQESGASITIQREEEQTVAVQ
jgi:biopolymer transport protein ExbD